jgi:dTDP-4-dehydrorhamnose 3,5-epimerase
VGVIRGEIFDVAVDIRRGSPTYGRAVTQILSAKNRRMLWVPRGFAHGFCVMNEEADVIYSMDEEYAPELDRGILWNDPAIGIKVADRASRTVSEGCTASSFVGVRQSLHLQSPVMIEQECTRVGRDPPRNS